MSMYRTGRWGFGSWGFSAVTERKTSSGVAKYACTKAGYATRREAQAAARAWIKSWKEEPTPLSLLA